MIFEKANYHCLQTCLSNAFPCFASKAPRVKPLALIPPIPPQRRAPCPAFLSRGLGVFFSSFGIFSGLCFYCRNRRRAGDGRGAGGKLRTRGKPAAGRAGEGAFSLRRLCIATLRNNLIFQKSIFIITDGVDDKKVAGGASVPRFPGKARSAPPAAPGGMRRDARTAPRGCPASHRPPAQAPRFIILITIF